MIICSHIVLEKINHSFMLFPVIICPHVVLDVRLATVEKKNPARLVVSVLTTEVERGEAAAVLDVEVGLQRINFTK